MFLCLASFTLQFFFEAGSHCVAQVGVQWHDRIIAHWNLCLLGSSYSHASVTQVVGIIGVCHHTQLILVFLVEMGFCYVGQVGLELLTSGDPPVSASQSDGITGVSHCAQPEHFLSCGTGRYSRPLFYLPCLSSSVRHLSTDPWFFYVEVLIKLIAPDVAILLGLFSR